MGNGGMERVLRSLHECNVRGGRVPASVPAAAHLAVTAVFLVFLASFGKYSFSGVLGMCLYPFALALLWHVPVFRGVAGMWYVFLPVAVIAAANPFLDREAAAKIGSVTVSGGWISFSVLCLKGALAILSSKALIRMTGVEGMARALCSFGLPPSSGFAFMLMHRYLLLIVKEIIRMRDAYALRSGGRTSIAPSVWGSFAGLLLLRSSDRAKRVREAAALRGYHRGCLPLRQPAEVKSAAAGWTWFLLWTAYFAATRVLEPVTALGHVVLALFAACS